jgi:hypothetical protein
VWNDEHPAPTQVGADHEREVCRWLDQQASTQLDALMPSDEDSLARFRQIMGGAWQVIFDLGLPMADQIEYQHVGESAGGSMRIERGILRNKVRDSELPLLTVRDAEKSDDQTVVVWTSRFGKDGAFDRQGRASPTLKKMIDSGATVLLPDLLGQGEFNTTDQPLEVQRLVADERSYSAFTFAYNRTLAAQRCGDLLTVVAYALQQRPDNVRLLSSKGSAAWAAPAAALGGNKLDRVLLEVDGFRYGQSESYRDADFVPGAVKYGDLPVLLALRSPHPLMVVGEQQLPQVVAKAYAAADAGDHVTLSKSPTIGDAEIDWLLQ